MKADLLNYCKVKVTQSMLEIKENLKLLQSDANSNSKSAMGDKYETNRAMIHLEQENLASRYYNLEKQLKVLMDISTQSSDSVMLGSIIRTESTSYFLTVGLGKIDFNGEVIYAIAANSPIGQSLLGKKVGDKVTVLKNELIIKSVS